MTYDQKIRQYKASFDDAFSALKLLYVIEDERRISEYLQPRPYLLKSLAAIARAERENRANDYFLQELSLSLETSEDITTLNLSMRFAAKPIRVTEWAKKSALEFIDEYYCAWHKEQPVK